MGAGVASVGMVLAMVARRFRCIRMKRFHIQMVHDRRDEHGGDEYPEFYDCANTLHLANIYG